jgi:type II secretory pathway component PulF
MAGPPPIPIDYARPEEQSLAKAITSVGLTIALAIPYTFVTFLSFIAVPKFELMFRDFRMELPWITIVFLRFSRWFQERFGWAILLAMVLGLPIVIAQWRTRSPGRVYLRAALLVVLIVLFYGAMALFAVAALIAPSMSLIESVNKP